MRQLEQWIEAARAAGMIEPTAMTLATASVEGVPSARIVLYKGQHDGGPVFYSNYQSHKGRELQENPHAALVFWWDRLERQVRIEGRVERLPRAMSDDYFKSRPLRIPGLCGGVAPVKASGIARRARRAHARGRRKSAGRRHRMSGALGRLLSAADGRGILAGAAWPCP